MDAQVIIEVPVQNDLYSIVKNFSVEYFGLPDETGEFEIVKKAKKDALDYFKAKDRVEVRKIEDTHFYKK